MQIDKISFGTTPRIGKISATIGLQKQPQTLCEGITNAFKILEQNNKSDELFLRLVYIEKHLSTDELDLSLHSGGILKSSKRINLKKWNKFNTEDITTKIIEIYEKLADSSWKASNKRSYPFRIGSKITDEHQTKIDKLVSDYAFDDWKNP